MFTWQPPGDPNGIVDNKTLTEAVQALHAFVLAATGQPVPAAPQPVVPPQSAEAPSNG